MRYILLILFVLSELSGGDAFSAGVYSPYRDFQIQIRKYREEIQKIENLINDNNFNIDNYRIELKNIIKELNHLSEIIKNSGEKELDSESKLLLLESELTNQITKLEQLRNSFRNKVVWLYKNGSDYSLQILFTSGNLNQLYTRFQYLQKISQMRIKDYEKILMESYILEEKKKLMKMNESERNKYFAEKKEMRKEILFNKVQTENIIDSLEYLNELLTRRKQILNTLLGELDMYSSVISTGLNFKIHVNPGYGTKKIEELKGELILPVPSNYILIDFGKSINPSAKVFTYNNGIDFLVSAGSDVSAVYEGEIYGIFNLPDFGNTVIIKHNEIYYSVYSVLGMVKVEQGQQIKSGQVIGTSSMNLNGQCFHFELRENFIPVDPKEWLKWN
jgi:septal ring factor EnvC (AmiA/AmiB activator)